MNINPSSYDLYVAFFYFSKLIQSVLRSFHNYRYSVFKWAIIFSALPILLRIATTSDSVGSSKDMGYVNEKLNSLVFSDP